MSKAVKNVERDALIVERYKAGENQQRLALAFHITRSRVGQILQKAGVSYEDNPNAPKGDRYGFVGSNITRDLKSRLMQHAKASSKSMSRVLSDALEEYLAKRKNQPERKKA